MSETGYKIYESRFSFQIPKTYYFALVSLENNQKNKQKSMGNNPRMKCQEEPDLDTSCWEDLKSLEADLNPLFKAMAIPHRNGE